MQNNLTNLARIVRGQLYLDTSKSYKDTILLCGSGRSGTTWLAEIINNENSFRYMFEPFHPELVNIVKHFSKRQYLRDTDRREEYLLPASRIFSGKIRNFWIDRYNKQIRPQKRLIKDIRINLLLRWIKTNFPDISIVYILRHPFSVACSRLRLGWKDHLNDFLEQKDLCEDFSKIFNSFNIKHLDVFERQILLWCIENYVPITSLSSDEMYILFYENLFSAPVKEVERLFDHLNLPISNNLLNKITKPSPMTKKSSPLVTGENPLTYWEKTLTSEQKQNASNIMGKFGLNKIYCDKALPNKIGIQKPLNSNFL